MTDPLSVAAGIGGLISLGIQVTESLVKFYTSYKGQDTDAIRTTGKLEGLLGTFEYLHAALQRRRFRPDEQDLIKNIESSIHECDELIKELKEECEKFDRASTTGIKGTVRAAGRRATYPFRQSTLQKLDEAIGEIRHNLSLALDLLQLRDHKNTQDDITELKSLLEVVRANQISSTIRDWLKAPDATVNHNAACAKRHPGTGSWFVKDPVFTTWLTQDRSFLWLNGFAGCGKSILCSTAIQYTFRHRRSDRGVGIAIFYFTFNDESKQDESVMLRALLLQLSGQLSGSQTDLDRLRDSYRTGIPPVMAMIAHLRYLIQQFDQVYILLDALDESPRYGPRDQVLNVIQTMRKWLLPGLHLLVTSRDEPDIRESLSPTGNEAVIMKNAEINQDISDFISGQLTMDPKLRKLQAHHDRIQQVLAERAQGV
jgi:ankyrin repeat domain-containing protein 50